MYKPCSLFNSVTFICNGNLAACFPLPLNLSANRQLHITWPQPKPISSPLNRSLLFPMSRDVKPILYHYCRRGWHEQLLSVCDTILSRKNKDVFALFWRAYGMGMAGNITAALSLFEEHQSKRDMQFPSTLALIYFHKKLPSIDQELLDQLQSEASVSEDVTVGSPISFTLLTLILQ